MSGLIGITIDELTSLINSGVKNAIGEMIAEKNQGRRISSKEARLLLNISTTTEFRMVKKGVLKPLNRGMSAGKGSPRYYLHSDVERLITKK